MTEIVCEDNLGTEHVLPEESFIPRKAAYGILIHDNRILMVLDRTSGNWEFPGGGLETGETTLQGLRREILEETGLVISDKISEMGRFTEYFFDMNSNQAWKGDRSFWFVSVEGGKILETGNGDDVQEARMISPDAVENLRIKGNIKDIIGRLYPQYLKRNR